MTFRGRDIFSYQQVPRSHVEYSETFAWLEAARWRGYTNEGFADLEGDDQARIVAQWECSQQIDAVVTWYQTRKNRRHGT